MIECQQVSKFYSKHKVLDQVSFHINPFSFVRIKGASGSGKTTLLHLIAGFTPPDEGKIMINTQTASEKCIIIPPAQRGISMLFQDLALWPHMTAYENLAFVLPKIKNIEEQLHVMCRKIDFPLDLLPRYPHQLSGGEQQRLAIARTFIADKPIILLDEPYTSLDEDNRNRFIEYLRSIIAQRKYTIILVSHDLVADQIPPDQTFLLLHNKLTLLP